MQILGGKGLAASGASGNSIFTPQASSTVTVSQGFFFFFFGELITV